MPTEPGPTWPLQSGSPLGGNSEFKRNGVGVIDIKIYQIKIKRIRLKNLNILNVSWLITKSRISNKFDASRNVSQITRWQRMARIIKWFSYIDKVMCSRIREHVCLCLILWPPRYMSPTTTIAQIKSTSLVSPPAAVCRRMEGTTTEAKSITVFPPGHAIKILPISGPLPVCDIFFFFHFFSLTLGTYFINRIKSEQRFTSHRTQTWKEKSG